MNPSPRQEKQNNSERIRQSILLAARDVFLYRGYDATLDEIAETAGVARRSLFYIYGSKESLFLSVFKDLMELEDLFEGLDPTRDVKDVLMDFAKDYLARVLNEEQIAFHRLLFAEQKRFPDAVAKVANMHFARIAPPFKRYFNVLIKDGRFRRIDPAFVTEQFLALLVGSARVRLALGLGRDKPSRRSKYVETAIDSFVRGMQS